MAKKKKESSRSKKKRRARAAQASMAAPEEIQPTLATDNAVEMAEESEPRCPNFHGNIFRAFPSNDRIFCWDCNKFFSISDSQPAKPQKQNLFRTLWGR